MSESNTIISNRSLTAANSPSHGGASRSHGGGASHHGDGSQPPPPPSSADAAITFIGGVSLPDQLEDAAASLQLARQDGFDYVVTSLPDAAASAEGGEGGRPRTDVTQLESKWWSTSVVGLVSDPPRWRARRPAARGRDGAVAARQASAGEAAPRPLDEGRRLVEALTCTSASAASLGRKAEASKVFWGMMEWASHMSIPAVILPPVPLWEHEGDETVRGGATAKVPNPAPSSEDEDMFAAAPGPAAAPNHPKNKRGRIHHIQRRVTAAAPARAHHPAAPAAAPAADPNNASAKEYAGLLARLAASSVTAHVQLWIRVPLDPAALAAFQLLLARCDGSPHVGCVLCVSERLDAAELPAAARALHAFLGGGHVRAVSWDAGVFLQNRKGYPTLSKLHQSVFTLLYGRLGRTLRTLIEGRAPVGGPVALPPGAASRRLHHLQYLRHLRSARPSLAARLDAPEAILETPYLDNLQSPLQPLGDHLEYQTYETFEKDPVKYERYGAAVAMALRDGMAEDKFEYLGSTMTTRRQLRRMHGDAATAEGAPDGHAYGRAADYAGGNHVVEDAAPGRDNEEDIVGVDVYRVTILVVGAGRGPLVREAVAAVARVSAALLRRGPRGGGPRRALHARIVAVEKNPGAVLYLRSLKAGDPAWNGGRAAGAAAVPGAVVPGASEVTVVGCDMRDAAAHPALRGRPADVVVSELLGSFGDNELSPECLDGVQRCGLLKDGCVSVPQSYTAFLAPVSSARLHSEAKTQACHPLHTEEGAASPAVGLQRALETPYVVRSHAASQTHEERPCWTFSHPHAPAAAAPAPADRDAAMADEGGSAKAADDVDNDRRAHLAFARDPVHGAGFGCGYGAVDPEAVAMAAPAMAAPAPAGVEVPSEGGWIGASCNSEDITLTIHGFLGSFEALLYETAGSSSGESVEELAQERSSIISIAPHSFSVGMFSWFPLYFPLKEPLLVPPGATLNCSIWRRSDEKRVWYEWCAEVVSNTTGGAPVVWSTSAIHNPGGRSSHVNK